MFQMKSFVACVILLVMWQHIEAGKLNKIKSNKRYDEALQTDIYESIYVDNDMQADATTVYPPLIEEPSKPPGDGETAPPDVVSDDTKPPKSDENKTPPPEYTVVQPPESTSDAPATQYNPYNNLQYYSQYYNPYIYYPWPHVPQQPYYTQQNVQGQQQPQLQQQQQQQTVYMQPQQPEYEGILVPVQTSQQQPTRSQLPSSPSQTTQTQNTQSRPETAPVTHYAGPGATAIAAANNSDNSEQSKTPAPLTNRHSFDLALLLQAILPQNIIQLLIVIGNFVLNSFSTLAFAGAITSLLCSLTPVCTISFGAFPFGVRKILVNGPEISTIQRVRRAAEMVTNALDKYEKIQKGVESLTNSLKKQTQKKI